MKRIFGALLAVLLTTALTQAPATARSGHRFWRLVVNDQFNAGGVPHHWSRYDGPYGSGPENCARPDHAKVRHGKMLMVLSYRSGGNCGGGWYSAGMQLAKRFQSVSQRITVRYRIRSFHGVHGHRIIPMRWPTNGPWPTTGEEDFCESSAVHGCSTFLHSDSEVLNHGYRLNQHKWHKVTFVRRHYHIRAFIDGHLRWHYKGNRRTLPPTMKRPVLQQECQSSCPSGTTGREVIQIDWVKVWNPRR